MFLANNSRKCAFCVLFLPDGRVRELTDDAFARVTEVTFPVENIADCLR